MPNRHYNKQVAHPLPKGDRPSPSVPGGGKQAFKEKPSFPSADLPGKAQGKDRSGGVTKCKVNPKQIGL